MAVSMLPIKGASLGSFEELLEKNWREEYFFSIPEFHFDHVVYGLGKNSSSRVISEAYLNAIEKLDIAHKCIGKK